MKEDRRSVLRPKIRSLPVHLRRVMHLPEHIEQLLVAHFRRIKRHPHHLGMPRLVRANIFVGGIHRFAAAVPHCRINHSRHLLKSCFNSPEAPCSECRNFLHFLLLACLSDSAPLCAQTSRFRFGPKPLDAPSRAKVSASLRVSSRAFALSNGSAGRSFLHATFSPKTFSSRLPPYQTSSASLVPATYTRCLQTPTA